MIQLDWLDLSPLRSLDLALATHFSLKVIHINPVLGGGDFQKSALIRLSKLGV